MLEIDQLGKKVCFGEKRSKCQGEHKKRETYTSANSDVAYIWAGRRELARDSGVSLPVLWGPHHLQMPTVEQPHVVPDRPRGDEIAGTDLEAYGAAVSRLTRPLAASRRILVGLTHRLPLIRARTGATRLSALFPFEQREDHGPAEKPFPAWASPEACAAGSLSSGDRDGGTDAPDGG